MFDPFGIHSQMNSMMRGFMMDPFGQPPMQQQQQQQRGGTSSRGQQQQQLALRDPFGMSASPFDRHNQMMMMQHDPFNMMSSMMTNMNGMFRNFDNQQHFVSSDPNSQVFSSSSMITYSNSGDGKPKVYQESKQIRQGPGGVRETRELVRDSTKGLEKVAIGHHIGDRAHIIERQKMNNGPMEEIVNLENLDEEELPEFNQEFESKIASRSRTFNNHNNHRSLHLNNNHPLAIEDTDRPKKEKSKSKSKSSSKHQ